MSLENASTTHESNNYNKLPDTIREIIDLAIVKTGITTEFDETNEISTLRIHYTPQLADNAHSDVLLSLSWYLVGKKSNNSNALQLVSDYLIENNTDREAQQLSIHDVGNGFGAVMIFNEMIPFGIDVRNHVQRYRKNLDKIPAAKFWELEEDKDHPRIALMSYADPYCFLRSIVQCKPYKFIHFQNRAITKHFKNDHTVVKRKIINEIFSSTI